MSLYEQLPVYKSALDLAVYFEKIVSNFERSHKFTIGADLKNLSRRILVLVAKANTKQSRKECLVEVLDKLEELKIIIHLCKEIKAFRSLNSFEFATKSVIEVSKQCEGWLRSQNFSGVKLEEAS
ncbi:MAG: four helix bundle protein [Candidatus Omnitrophota bacterium]